MQTTPEQDAYVRQQWAFNPDIREWKKAAAQRWNVPQEHFANLPQGGDFDYNAAILNGVTPKAYEQDGGFPHWASEAQTMTGRTYELKSPDHPTLWKAQFMQQFGVNPDEIDYASASQDQQQAMMDAYQRQGLLALTNGGNE